MICVGGGASYHRGGVKLRYDVVEEGCEVGGAGLELLDAVKAVTLAVCLQQGKKKRGRREFGYELFDQLVNRRGALGV